jgi:hypothetical protein
MGKGGQIGARIPEPQISFREGLPTQKRQTAPWIRGPVQISYCNRRESSHSFDRNGIRVGKYADRFSACITVISIVSTKYHTYV